MNILNNPELRRNVWIECRPLRMLAVIWVPLLIFLFPLQSTEPAGAVFMTAHYVIVVSVIFWGARKAADAMSGELRDRTWDQQRLSGIGPITMTLGKVFGAPSAVWLLILVCVAAQVFALIDIDSIAESYALADAPGSISTPLTVFWFGVAFIASELLGALFVFALAFFASVLALNGQERPRSFDATLFQVVGLIGAIIVFVFAQLQILEANRLLIRSSRLPIELDLDAGRAVPWWDVTIASTLLTPMLFVFAAGWALHGGVHQMRRALAETTTTRGWIVFLLSLGVLLAGFSQSSTPLLAAAGGLGVATLAAALLEPHKLISYRLWLGRIAAGSLTALTTAPAWLYAWLGASVLLIGAFLNGEILPEWELLQLFGESTYGSVDLRSVLFASILFLLRDCLLCVWAGLRAPDGRGFWAALLILSILYFVLGPLLAIGADAAGFALFAPIDWTSVTSALIQAAVALGLVIGELRQPTKISAAPEAA